MQDRRKKWSLYGRRWQQYRKQFLVEHPLCEMHQARGQVVAAEVVDHKTPHRGDESLFWDTSNHQALCKQCHDSHKQRMEKTGRVVGCDANGIPLDQGHHWRRW